MEPRSASTVRWLGNISAFAEFLRINDPVIGLIRSRKSGNLSAWASQSKLPLSTIAPPTQVAWPSIYFVVECVTISAPHSKGRQLIGSSERIINNKRYAVLMSRMCEFSISRTQEQDLRSSRQTQPWYFPGMQRPVPLPYSPDQQRSRQFHFLDGMSIRL